MKNEMVMVQESFLENLKRYYNDNKLAKDYIEKNIPTPKDVDVFAIQHNLSTNYQAKNMEATTESFVHVINDELKKLYG
jgi:hypothetical protein